jgi:hypothetical protein
LNYQGSAGKRAQAARRPGVQFLSGGLHCKSLDATCVKQVFVDRIIPGTRHVVFHSLTPPGIEKPPQYWTLFGTGPTQHFNTLVRSLADALNVTFFNTHAALLNMSTFDGQHYPHGANLIVAQLALNLLAAFNAEDATAANSSNGRRLH